MARNRKNGKFSRTTRRRSSKSKTNITNLAVSALVANQITRGLFNTNLQEFVTGNTGSNGTAGWGTDGSTVLSLPELIGLDRKGVSVGFGGNYGAGKDLQSVLVQNFKANWVKMTFGVVVIPIVAKTAMKLIRKPVILPANRMLKSVGLDVKV